MAIVPNSLQAHESSLFISLFESNTQDWPTFSTNFLEKFDSAIIKFQAEAELQIFDLKIFDNLSKYAYRVESLVSKGWYKIDCKRQNGQ